MPHRHAAVAACALLAAAVAAAPAAADDPTPAPAPYEPIAISHIPLPKDVSGMSEVNWLPDGRHLVTAFTSPANAGAQLDVVADDGSDFHCLTCGMAQVVGLDRPFNALNPLSLGKPFVFSDGKRVLTRDGGRPDNSQSTLNPLSGPTQDFNYLILECEPSLLDCRHRALLPLELPGGGLTRGVQNREARISPDMKWLAWTEVQLDGTRMSIGRLVRGASSYTVTDVRVLNPPFDPTSTDPAVWATGAPLYELKRFGDGGRTVFYASFADAENYDDFELDLATGARRRVTRDLEWNEDTSESPDGTSLIIPGSRTRDRMTPFDLLQRPPFVDFGVYTMIGRFQLNAVNRKCLLDPWLMDRRGERGTYAGQPVDPFHDPKWGSHGIHDWNPQGTKVAFWEFNDAAQQTVQDPDAHVNIATLTARRPHAGLAIVPTPDPVWATPRDQWHGYQSLNRSVTLKGPRAGTVALDLYGSTNTQLQTATYTNWSSDGKTFLDGTERTVAPAITTYGRWIADLRVHGEHHGFLKADVAVTTAGKASGTLTTEVDGRRFEGLPTDKCKPLAAPRLVVRARLHRAAGGRGVAVVHVTGLVPGDRVARPVRHVRVRVGAAHAYTDDDGAARVGTSGVRAVVTAQAPGFLPATAALLGR